MTADGFDMALVPLVKIQVDTMFAALPKGTYTKCKTSNV